MRGSLFLHYLKTWAAGLFHRMSNNLRAKGRHRHRGLHGPSVCELSHFSNMMSIPEPRGHTLSVPARASFPISCSTPSRLPPPTPPKQPALSAYLEPLCRRLGLREAFDREGDEEHGQTHGVPDGQDREGLVGTRRGGEGGCPNPPPQSREPPSLSLKPQRRTVQLPKQVRPWAVARLVWGRLEKPVKKSRSY